MQGFTPAVLVLKIREKHQEPGNVGSLQNMRMTPGQQPTRKQGPRSYNLIELNSANNPNDCGRDSPLRASTKEWSSINTSISALWDPKQSPLNFWPTGLWDSKWGLFSAAKVVVICSNSNRKVIHYWKLNLLLQKDLVSCRKSHFWIWCEHHNCKRLERRLERSDRKNMFCLFPKCP